MSIAKRGLLTAALTAATTGLLATSSLASANQPKLDIYFSDVLVGADSSGTTERVLLLPSQPMMLNGVTTTIDYADVVGKVTISASPGAPCTTTTTTVTCAYTYPLNYSGGGPFSILPDFAIKPVAGTPEGTTGELKITVTARDLPPATTTSTVTIGEGIDLAAGPSQEMSAGPGEPFSPSLEVGNVGEAAAHGAVAVFWGDYGLMLSKSYSNCTFNEGSVTSCIFDEDLLPGTTYRSEEPLPFVVRPDSGAPGSVSLGIVWLTPAEFKLMKDRMKLYNPGWLGSPGTGSRLELVEKVSANRNSQVDLDPTNNRTVVTVNITGDNPADLAALGGSSSGAVGFVVRLDLGAKNLGPASLDSSHSGEPTTQVRIELPRGAALTEMPEGCMAIAANGLPDQENPGNLAARSIGCWPEGFLFRAGTQVVFPVKLRIDQVIANATGKVRVLPPFCQDVEACPKNYNESNNNADIVLNATASLPITGVQAGLIAGAGTLLLVAGAGLFMLARRRRFNPLREG